jgi:hypothetical protein
MTYEVNTYVYLQVRFQFPFGGRSKVCVLIAELRTCMMICKLYDGRWST